MTEIKLTESKFMAQVIQLAKMYGWQCYFTWKSINSPAGFPDLVMVHDARLIFAELKADKGKVSLSQQEWLDALKKTKAEVYCWFPKDWPELQEVITK